MRLRTEHRSSVLPQIRFHGACVAQFETSLVLLLLATRSHRNIKINQKYILPLGSGVYSQYFNVHKGWSMRETFCRLLCSVVKCGIACGLSQRATVLEINIAHVFSDSMSQSSNSPSCTSQISIKDDVLLLPRQQLLPLIFFRCLNSDKKLILPSIVSYRDASHFINP